MKILVADGVSPKGIEILQKAGFETVIKDKLPAEELLEIKRSIFRYRKRKKTITRSVMQIRKEPAGFEI